jgi:DNA-directed RNA polymerase subunit M/transcription elongation factor TFIIS
MVRICPQCGADLAYHEAWNGDNKISSKFECPKCKYEKKYDIDKKVNQEAGD